MFFVPMFVPDAVLVSAPSIFENVDIKKGILLQLFGGTRKDFTEEGRSGHFRSLVVQRTPPPSLVRDRCES